MVGGNRTRIWQVSLVALLASAGCSNETGNRPPVLTGVTAVPAQVAPGGTISVAVSAVDPDGDALKYEWTAPDGWTVIGDTTGATLALTAPATASAGVAIVKVTDGRGGSVAGQAVVSTITGAAPTVSLSASPNPVTPGGQVIVAAALDGAPDAATYTWETSDPEWVLTGTGATVTMTAPATYGASTAVTVTADDGHGRTSIARIAVSTLPAVPPWVSGLTATPNPVTPGGTMAVIADVLNPSGLALSYTWAIGDSSWAITGNSPTATVTAPAVESAATTVTFTVTDAAGASATATIPVYTDGVSRPVAAIAGTPPLHGVVNVGVPLDGSGSASPAGHPLVYTWTVVNAPHGAVAQFFDDVGGDGSWTATPFFAGDTAGTYDLRLQVTDAQAPSWVDYATTQVSLAGPGKVVVVSGDAQTGTVAKDLANPLIVKVTTTADEPVPGIALSWRCAGGTIFFGDASGTTGPVTDSDGVAAVTVRPARIAGTGKVTAAVAADPSIAADLSFTGTADKAAYIAAGLGVATVIDGLHATVQVVDQFGNPATDHADANTSQVRLTLWSQSGNARFNPPGGSQSTTLTATLVNGSFSVPIKDDLAELLSVAVSPGPTAVPDLPFVGWNVSLYDPIEAGFTGSMSGPWAIGTGSAHVHSGGRSLAADLTPSLLVGQFQYDARESTGAAGARMTKLEFWHQALVPAVQGTAGGRSCTFQPRLSVAMRNATSDYLTVPVPPLAGYPVVDLCDDNGSVVYSSFGSTTGWEASLFDITDAVGAGYTNMAFRVENPGAAHSPGLPAAWYVDDIKVTQLTSSSLNGATATGRLLPGPAVKVQFASSIFTPFAPGSCLSGPATTSPVEADIVDAKGNTTLDNEIALRLAWSGTATWSVPTVGSLVSQSGSVGYVDIRFANGQAVFNLADTAIETVAVHLENPFGLAGLDLTSTAGALFPQTWACHQAWNALYPYSDATPSTYTLDQALKACREFVAYSGYFPANTRCVASATYPNTVTASSISLGYAYWAFGAGAFPPDSPACLKVHDTTPACNLVVAPVCAPNYAAGNAWFDIWTATPSGTNPACGEITGYQPGSFAPVYGMGSWN